MFANCGSSYEANHDLTYCILKAVASEPSRGPIDRQTSLLRSEHEVVN